MAAIQAMPPSVVSTPVSKDLRDKLTNSFPAGGFRVLEDLCRFCEQQEGDVKDYKPTGPLVDPTQGGHLMMDIPRFRHLWASLPKDHAARETHREAAWWLMEAASAFEGQCVTLGQQQIPGWEGDHLWDLQLLWGWGKLDRTAPHGDVRRGRRQCLLNLIRGQPSTLIYSGPSVGSPEDAWRLLGNPKLPMPGRGTLSFQYLGDFGVLLLPRAVLEARMVSVEHGLERPGHRIVTCGPDVHCSPEQSSFRPQFFGIAGGKNPCEQITPWVLATTMGLKPYPLVGNEVMTRIIQEWAVDEPKFDIHLNYKVGTKLRSSMEKRVMALRKEAEAPKSKKSKK